MRCINHLRSLLALLLDALRAGERTSQVGARTITLREIHEIDSVSGCNVLYLETQSARRIEQVLPNSAMLTVSDGKGFANAGGTIELFTQANRRISSNLLQLAAVVEDGAAR